MRTLAPNPSFMDFHDFLAEPISSCGFSEADRAHAPQQIRLHVVYSASEVITLLRESRT